MTPARKRLAILIVLVGSALIGERVYSLAVADDDVAEAVVPKRSGRDASTHTVEDTSSEPAPSLRLDSLDARQMALSESVEPWPRTRQLTPFDSVNWQPTAPIPTPAARLPKPVAPPFSYTYMGSMTEDGVRTAFFTRANRTLLVKVGDTVDATFRIDQMTDKTMKLTYLPLNETIELALGGER